MAGRWHRLMVVAAIGAGAAAFSGCSTGERAASAGTAQIDVKERDFRISAPHRVPAGDVVLSAANTGPDAHELIVVRGRNSRLPTRADDVTIDEDALQSRTAGTLEPFDPGTVRQLDVHLKPGHYVMFCNMAGHHLGGMHADFVVQ